MVGCTEYGGVWVVPAVVDPPAAAAAAGAGGTAGAGLLGPEPDTSTLLLPLGAPDPVGVPEEEDVRHKYTSIRKREGSNIKSCASNLSEKCASDLFGVENIFQSDNS